MDRTHRRPPPAGAPRRAPGPPRRSSVTPVAAPATRRKATARADGPAHGRPRSPVRKVVAGGAAAVIVFVLALLLVTGVEVVLGEPLSGGHRGQTSLGEVLHPAR
ncbi:hypothetical protein Acsp06_50190 [Actinomycetospora sp. NBRC 106375]|nr:hypothetical protein Acsp06_50190 [Actinomycetospora sp. NBRC 106375]